MSSSEWYDSTVSVVAAAASRTDRGDTPGRTGAGVGVGVGAGRIRRPRSRRDGGSGCRRRRVAARYGQHEQKPGQDGERKRRPGEHPHPRIEYGAGSGPLLSRERGKRPLLRAATNCSHGTTLSCWHSRLLSSYESFKGCSCHVFEWPRNQGHICRIIVGLLPNVRPHPSVGQVLELIHPASAESET